MKFCGNRECGNYFSQFSRELRCDDCGEELLYCVTCICGKAEVNPKYEAHFQNTHQIIHHCKQCGIPLTSANLGHMMADALRGMMRDLEVSANGRAKPLD